MKNAGQLQGLRGDMHRKVDDDDEVEAGEG